VWFLLPSHHDNGAFVCVYNSTISSHLAVLSSLMASWLVALCYDFDALVVCCRCFFCLCCCEDWLQHVSVVISCWIVHQVLAHYCIPLLALKQIKTKTLLRINASWAGASVKASNFDRKAEEVKNIWQVAFQELFRIVSNRKAGWNWMFKFVK